MTRRSFPLTKLARRLGATGGLLGLGAMVCVSPTWAMQIDTGEPELKLTWDNTVKYSTAYRLKNPSAGLTADPGQDDGDRNFKRGIVSNRFDLLSEVDVKYRRFGARVSGAAWYDTVYNRTNDNDSFGALGGPFPTTNQTGPYNEFPIETRDLHGRKAELLDAFVFGGFDLGEMRASFRLGKHTVLWGESLFLGANGIAAAQAPIDVIKGLSVPGTQFKELIRPVQQVSGTLQVSDAVSIGAYYQFRWEANRIPASGSYFSFADNAGAGAERLVPAAISPPGSDGITRAGDLRAKNSGQGGLQLRLRVGEADLGLYAVRFHAKDFEQVVRLNAVTLATGAPPPNPATVTIVAPGSYQLVFPEDITAYGASYSQTFGDVNFATEGSVRRNMPFLSQVTVGPGQAYDNSGNVPYAVGTSGHLQASVLWQLPKTPLFNEGTVAAEVAYNRALSVQKNEAAIDPNTTKDAWALRFVATPLYRQALPGLDVEVPIGLGYNPSGRSRVVPQFNNGAATHGGDFSVGLNGIYLDAWRFGLNYTHYFGPEGTYVEADPRDPTGQAKQRSFKAVYRDRDFISFTARTSF